ncbi:MAG: hypothetical protein WKF89_01755 [Chitinophagaceae bacterium]
MKIFTPVLVTCMALFMAVVILPGCLKDKRVHTYTIYTPVYKTNAEVRANIKSNSPQDIKSPGKLFIKGQYIYLNEVDRGIHIIDNTNPAMPRNIAFIDIPGNMDMAVKGDMLYADLYTDLVAIDISDPLHIETRKIIDNAFPERRYTNGFVAGRNKIIVNWTKRDTTVVEDLKDGFSNRGCTNCLIMFDNAAASFSAAKSPFGIGGSMARFSIVGSSLYTVGSSDLNVYTITSPENPVFANKVNMGWGIETIYPFKSRLFIGSSTGMFIYDITNPLNPAKLGQFSHLTACDPVIADDDFAFVTLSSGVRCSNASNQMEVLDISNLNVPFLVKTYPMTNPHGLSKDGSTLFVCDGKDGLKIFDASNVKDIKLKTQMKGYDSYDVIASNKLAVVVSKDGLRQYDYSNLNNIKLLSTIGWAQ